MKYLKLAGAWLKANVVIVICVVVAVASVIMILRTKSNADNLRQELATRGNKIAQLNGLTRVSKTIPSPDPNAPAQSITLTITRPAIDAIERVFHGMQGEYEGVRMHAIEINSAYHVPMLEGLFPAPPEGDNLPRRAEAATAYRDAFRRMFEPYSPSSTIYPALNARLPRDHRDELASFERNYLTSNFIPARTSLAQLSPEEREKYNEARLQREVELIRHDAETIHVYADSNMESSGFPFAVGGWSSPARAGFPTMTEIWDGQMDLWLQQDVARAIARANNSSSAEWNVMVAPVKVLVSIRPTTGERAEVAVQRSGMPASGGMDMGDFGQAQASATPDAAPTVGEGLSASPTGRVSNDLYEVRYVNVQLIADYKQLPELFEAIAHTNFMTIVDLSVRDVDEYDWLKRGYHFGNADAVEVTMRIETLWLHAWLVDLMPEEVLRQRGMQRTSALPTTP